MTTMPAELTNTELHKTLLNLTRNERTSSLTVIDHLTEVGERRLFLRLGHGSLFAYCTDALGYSGADAWRRVGAVFATQRFPEIRERLRSHRVSLDALAIVGREITRQNCTEVLRRLEGRSARDAERLLAELKGLRPTKETIRPVKTVAPTPVQPEDEMASRSARPQASATPDNRSVSPDQTHPQSGQRPPDGDRVGDLSIPTGLTPTINYEFRFAGTAGFIAKYQRAAALLSNKLGTVTISGVFEALLDSYLDRFDPTERERRRERRGNAVATPEPATRHPGRRAIPQRVRDIVHRRDGGRCTFVSSDGTRCSQTQHLQFDHIKPYSLGGSHNPSNVRLLCAAHNRERAERTFGNFKRKVNEEDG